VQKVSVDFKRTEKRFALQTSAKSSNELRMKLPVALFCFVALSVAAADAPSIYEQPEFRTATIYDHHSQRKTVLFKLTRSTTRSGNELNVVRDFTSPQGALAVRERMTYDGNKLVSCDMDDHQLNAKGSAKIVRDSGKAKIVFEYTKDGKRKTASETFHNDTVNNDMIYPFLAAHWTELMNGDAVKCRYIVLSRTETIGFEFVKQRETTARGMPVVIVKMAPSSMLIAAVVDPLIFTIEKNGQHRVLDYDGRTTPKIKQGDKFKDLDALTVFDWAITP
jgi:hypothetical protein